MKTTITLNKETRKRLNITKQTLGCRSIDEVINRIFDIVEKMGSAE